ncbi:MAG: hypothetical protein COA88_08405 [Kordia sp.]|nr:MAG: hypothetical protein COA88_08405 [Kordia sp.]
MKGLIKIIFFLLLIKSSAQIKTNLTIETSTGYEYNIFKSPISFLDNGVLKGKNELYKNSLFQEGSIRFLAKKKWKKQSFSFRFNSKGINYFSEKKSNYFTFLPGLRYINKLNKKTIWRVDSWYKIKNREGENVDGSELNFPLGNNHFGLATSLDFRLYKQNRSVFKVVYGNRDYKKSNGSDLSYNAIGVTTVIRNVFKRKAGWHSYGIVGGFTNKFFQQKNLTTNVTAKFNWKDMSATLFYRYPITKKLYLKPSFEYKTRIDSNKDKFSYTQLKPSLNLAYKNNKMTLGLTGSYSNRTYKALIATDNSWNKLGELNYQYFQLKLGVERKFNKKFSITASGFLNNRTSNKTNTKSMYFRAYSYYNLCVGFKYRF